MKILFLNRRDIKNPAGGGAEVYTHEIARGLVEKHGCSIVHLSCRFRDSHDEEVVDGIRYVRFGNELTVHIHGLLYAVRNRKDYDLIIDQFNGIGFFTFFMPTSIILIYQLYREFWFRELGPAGVLPYFFEIILLRLYRNKQAITISDSTKHDLERSGFKNIHIVMVALKNPPLSHLPGKEKQPTIVFLGRLKATKRPEEALEVFRIVKKKIPDARLWMIGRGPDEDKLKHMARGMDDVIFHGYVDEARKMGLLRSSHLLLVPSIREGFGINVIEAASQGTPAIGYNVPGLKDSILHDKTGFLVRDRDEAAETIVKILSDEKLYTETSYNCLDYVRDFTWQKRVDEFWQIIGPPVS